MCGFPLIGKKAIGQRKWFEGEVWRTSLMVAAVGVLAGVATASVKLHLGLPGHKALFWMVPIVLARVLSRHPVGGSIGSLTAGRMSEVRVRFRVWLSSADAEGIFGDGKWRLLQAVDETGSLKAAAEKLGISYRKAWGDLKKAEEHLKVALIEKHRGGQVRGETHLTEAGRKWMQAYSRFRGEIEEAVRRAYETHISGLT